MKKIVVLGAGMVGRVMASDLAAEFEVTSVDFSPANLSRLEGTPVRTVRADLASEQVVREIVVG